MRALITGSAGFIGRHFSRELESRRWEVWGYDITEGDDFLQKISDGHPWQIMDLVVHCAYHVGGRASIDGTNTNLFKNLQLDSAMFDWAVRTKQKRVLYFSSSAVYPVTFQQNDGNQERLSDSLFVNPFTADADYGYAKAVGERMAETARENGVPVTVVRPFSGYSEDQSLDYPFPSILQRARAGDLTVWGPQGQTRDWIHVDDVVRGALAVVESGTTDPVNLCTGVGTEMGELALKVQYALGNYELAVTPGKLTYDTSKPTGVFYRVGDPTRMLQYYTPKVSLEEGIRRALSAS